MRYLAWDICVDFGGDVVDSFIASATGINTGLPLTDAQLDELTEWAYADGTIEEAWQDNAIDRACYLYDRD